MAVKKNNFYFRFVLEEFEVYLKLYFNGMAFKGVSKCQRNSLCLRCSFTFVALFVGRFVMCDLVL